MLTEIVETVFLVSVLCIVNVYLFLGIISMFYLVDYRRTNKNNDYRALLSSPLAIPITIILPAYNESKRLVDKIKALSTLEYNLFEIVVVNDGSTDDSLAKLIAAFDLSPSDLQCCCSIPTETIRCVYKSQSKVYASLVVIDKEHGGKADALNAGVNMSRYPYFVTMDADTFTVPDVLLKLSMPFISNAEDKIIATGGVVRINNKENCEVRKLNLCKPFSNWQLRFQQIAYLRTFLLQRLGWSKLNGVLSVSGVLGMFDKEVVVECGGYDSQSQAEDMDLVMRMRRYLYDNDIAHRVEFIPESLCWKEVPSTIDLRRKQLKKKIQGTIETLLAHKSMLFQPKYGVLGMFSYPFALFFESLGPLFVVLAGILLVVLLIAHVVSWQILLLVVLINYLFMVSFSFHALFFDEYSYNRYAVVRTLRQQFVMIFLEPITYQLVNVYWIVKEIVSYWRHSLRNFG